MASEVKTNKVSPATGSTTEVTGLITSTSDARGDVLYHDGTNFTRLAKPGTPAGEVLTFATSASDPAWVAAAAGGRVLQLLEHNLATVISSTSTSYVASGLTITMTPASTSSKFLLTLAGGECYNSTNNDYVYTTFYVGGSEVSDTGPYERLRTEQANRTPHSALCLHEPASVSDQTYTVYYKVGVGTGYFNSNVGIRVEFTVMELSS